MTTYSEFLRAKIKLAHFDGFKVQPEAINPMLFPHQRDIVRWAVEGGNRAIFASFGLGKSIMQCEWLLQIGDITGGRGLVVCPLGVRQELIRDAAKLGIDLQFIRTADEMRAGQFFITNYESIRDGKLDPTIFTAVSLDEASVLRSFGSKTYQEFLPLFDGVKFKLVNTATPSPNRFKELIHYAAFLGVMDSGQALTRFFQRDSEKAGNLTLLPAMEQEFWLWVASWAVFITKPSDLGYSDEGYDLPEMDVVYHEVPVDYAKAGEDRDGQVLMFQDPALGLSAAAAVKRDSLAKRVDKLMEIVDAHVGSSCTNCVCQELLPGKPGAATCQTERAGQAGEPGEEGGVSAPVPAGEPRGTSGKAAGAREAQLHGQQEGIPGAAEAQPAEEVRDHRATEAAHPASAGVSVPDLREVPCGTDGPLNRPLPCDRIGSRDSLSSVQFGLGAVRGKPGVAGACSGVPGRGMSPEDDQIVIWCDLNVEQAAIEQALMARGLSFSSVHGSLTTEEAERRIQEWRDRKTYALIGKPVMLGQGLNLQQCNKCAFVGVTYKFNDLIQAVHRIQRFGQKRKCSAHIVYSEAEREVLRTLQQKWAQHEEMVKHMTEIIKKYGLNELAMQDTLARSIGVKRIEVSGERFRVANNDCVEEAKLQDENSVDLIATSIPFSNHYEYSPSYNDFGHTDNNDHFWQQMDFLTPELLRILKPGRIYACHVKDRILFGNVTGAGAPTVSPFHCEAIMHGRKHGFDYMGMITVVTDVVRENNQTYRLGYTEMCKDGTKMGVGSPEYVILFRKPQTDRSRGYADTPVKHDKSQYSLARWQVDAHAFWRSSGNRMLTAEELSQLGPDKLASLFTRYSLEQIYDYQFHVKIGEELLARGALPSTFMSLAPGSHDPSVWHDVTRMLTLNGEQAKRAVDKHICPLQFDIVDRLIERYSNPDEVVYDPFCGLGTVPYRAILMGRRGGGSELNPQYFLDQVHYLKAAEREFTMPDLFAAFEPEKVAA